MSEDANIRRASLQRLCEARGYTVKVRRPRRSARLRLLSRHLAKSSYR